MKLKFEISELALEDLDNIWEYTVEQWSKEQANIYYNEIFSAIGKICENSDIGKPIDEFIVKINRIAKIIIFNSLIMY